MADINWGKIKEWDEKYYLRSVKSAKEYMHTPIERTEGNYLIMPDGTKLLDFFNGLYSVNAGYCVPKIQEAIREASTRYGYLWEAFCSDYRARAAKLIMEDILGSEDWPGKISFVPTGSEANEKAFIIAKQIKRREYIVTREYAYHGWTAGAVGATRMRLYRSVLSDPNTAGRSYPVPFHPASGFILTPAPYCFDCTVGHTYPECKGKTSDGTLPCVLTTRRIIESSGPDTIAAMVTEPIYGTGSLYPPDEYLPQLSEMLKELDILWICDEVMSGFGRTGKWFGYQWYDGVKPDIMTIAKGMVSSALPAAGLVVNKEIAEYLDKYRFWNVPTFAAHPIAMAATCANLEYMIENNLPEKSLKAGEYFGAELKKLQEKHETFGSASGQGVFWHIELVKNKQTNERFVKEDRRFVASGDTSFYPNNFILAKTAEKGVLMGGFCPNTLRVGMSCEVTKEEMDKAIDAFDYALTALDEEAKK